jgi:hypothetical protein
MHFHARRRSLPGGALHGALSLALFAGLPCACSDQLPLTFPATGVPLLVVNSTCFQGHCDSLTVMGFLSGGPEATVPWMVQLGTVIGVSACLTIPPSATYRNIAYRTDSTADTILFEWTPTQRIWLAALTPSSPPWPFWTPSTRAFVPALAAGWSVALPDSVAVQTAAPCTS